MDLNQMDDVVELIVGLLALLGLIIVALAYVERLVSDDPGGPLDGNDPRKRTPPG